MVFKSSSPWFWAPIGFVHGVLVGFRYPEQSITTFLASGIIYTFIWLFVAWIVLLIMASTARKPVGIFFLTSGTLLFIGSRSSPDFLIETFAILQLIISIPLLTPLVVKALRKNIDTDNQTDKEN
jgi:hypothetical protein